MNDERVILPVGQQVSLPGHFDAPVMLEAARPLAKGYECRVRLPDGTLDEAVISEQEAAAVVGAVPVADSKTALVNADQLRLLVESARIRLAYAHDRQFAVSLSGTRFCILWRFTYRESAIESGDAFVFCYPQGIELDGPTGISGPAPALVEKSGKTYRVRNYLDRGADEDLGMPSKAGVQTPLIDALHRTLWLMEKRPTELPTFLRDSRLNREQLRLVAQALAGPALKGVDLGDASPTPEISALAKLTANWQSVVEDAALTAGEKEERRKGQKQLI
jgi:hypothetical protein